MTDKERLEQLKNGSVFDNDDINWLMQQAELREYAEQALINQEKSSDAEIERLRNLNNKIIETANVIDERNQRYLKALEDISEGAGPPELIAAYTLMGEYDA